MPDRSYLLNILPFAEQTSLYNAMNLSVSILEDENRTIRRSFVGVYACPSDPSSGATRLGSPYFAIQAASTPVGHWEPVSFTSYVGCQGISAAWCRPTPATGCRVIPFGLFYSDGLINDTTPLPFAAITDGLSQTILVEERATTLLQGLNEYAPYFFEMEGWWFYGESGHTIANNSIPPNAYKSALPIQIGFRSNLATSLHPGGVNVLMADGSTRFIKDSIQSWPSSGFVDTSGKLLPLGVWQKLSTRAEGEVIDGGY